MDVPVKKQSSARPMVRNSPLVIGVTGHRDLVPEEVPAIEGEVRALIADIQQKFPQRPLKILSPLAEGADRLVALIAEDLGLDLVVPLPMPEALYANDFESSRSWAEFGRLTKYASEVVSLPLAPGNTEASIAEYGLERSRQYAEMGAYVAASADILLAVWDGKVLSDLGGTGHVVQFRRDGSMPDYQPHVASQPARDLVYHIVCSRDRANGQPAEALKPLETRWLAAGESEYRHLPDAWIERINQQAPAEGRGLKAPDISDEAYRFPLVIGVTGHRDLAAEEIPRIRRRVKKLFEDLQERYPQRRLRILSPLAEGADRLAVEVSLDMDIDIEVLLPMPRRIYYEDFTSEDAIMEFNRLFRRATSVLELPLARMNTLEDISKPGPARELQYAQMGVFLSAHCHILLALWDGKTSGQLGGTAQVVRFHHHDIMPGYSNRTVAAQQMLIDDESDLIYHIVCSRDKADGAPAQGYEPLECWWFTNDRHKPRTRDLPDQHKLVFSRGGEFSADATRFRDRIATESWPLMDGDSSAGLPAGLEDINHLFCIADWLAIHYQQLTMRVLQATHVLAFLMGFMFVLFSDLRTQEIYLLGFLAFFILAAALQRTAQEKGWHRKYLDYRALAEGLRVQFYMAAAGITSDNESKFTHDNFLQTQDPELGWIRNVMRVAGTRCDAMRQVTEDGLNFTIREWIGDEQSGQLGYYQRKAGQWFSRNRNTERMSLLSLAVSALVVVMILVAGDTLGDAWVDPLFVIMGLILLAYGVRQAYAQSIAEKELIKQYEFMNRVFENSERRLESAESDEERRQIIRALGGSCLDEHAEWILMHRDRSIDQRDIWRIGG